METVIHTHVGSYGLLIREGCIALIKKVRGGYTGLLDLPGGGIEHQETPVDALKRELFEEAGVTVSTYKLLTATSRTFEWKDDDYMEDLHHIGILYEVEVMENTLKSEADGLDSGGCHFYEIKKLHKDEITPFVYEGLSLLGYDISE